MSVIGDVWMYLLSCDKLIWIRMRLGGSILHSERFFMTQRGVRGCDVMRRPCLKSVTSLQDSGYKTKLPGHIFYCSDEQVLV